MDIYAWILLIIFVGASLMYLATNRIPGWVCKWCGSDNPDGADECNYCHNDRKRGIPNEDEQKYK